MPACERSTDELLTGYKKPEDIIGENGLLKELTKTILERPLEAEITDHLGYEKHDLIFSGRVDIFYAPILAVCGKEGVFQHPRLITSTTSV